MRIFYFIRGDYYIHKHILTYTNNPSNGFEKESSMVLDQLPKLTFLGSLLAT